MLKLTNITKSYTAGDSRVQALKDLTIEFRKNEFVSILGPSGCGKTTLLNIIGGLDRYDSGDLSVNGRSTKDFKDRDWDSYRNHSVGFVFQSYNLIPHQTVLSNVELALTLSGVSKKERRRRAEEVLKRVGLGDQLKKKPNQMSGGQMQRVAIARALINDPEILLADEPTGALDSETSIQIMDLLREISGEKLIIMVTHNPDLAEKYSSRTVKLLDGKIISDSMPYDSSKEPKEDFGRTRKPSMSLLTAMSLSLNNLMTKKGRTFLTAFAGSIGIIGIALILSLSSGFSSYIARVEEDTLSSYPIQIEAQTVDMTSLMSTMMNTGAEDKEPPEDGKLYTKNIMGDFMNTMLSQVQTNNLYEFKKYIEDDNNGVEALVNDIQYKYNIDANLYTITDGGEILQVNPSSVFESMSGSAAASSMPMGANMAIWSEMMDNPELLSEQYDVLAGRWPDEYDEAVLVTDENHTISDFVLYSLGLKDQSELEEMMKKLMQGENVETEETTYSYDDILELTYSLLLPTDVYEKDGEGWKDMSEDSEYMKDKIENAVKIKIVGIICPSENAVASAISGTLDYTGALTDYVIEHTNAAEIVQAQKEKPDTDVFTGLPFSEDGKAEYEEFDYSQLTPEQLTYFMSLSEEERAELAEAYRKPVSSAATYDSNMELLSAIDKDDPSGILIYPVNFDSKEKLTDLITDYNNEAINAGHKENTIAYTDYVALLMSSVSTIINTISYVLIAFVAISLVVSSIMIGIITYISVLERIKEIGILRSIGASKRDIARVFNAETLIVGFVSGGLGILVTLLLLIPANIIIHSLTGISGIASLPIAGAIILIVISMLLTFIAGLIPARIASGKDPVVALRSE